MYDLWEVNPEHLPAILAEVAAPSTTEPAWAGLSVTMPHKQTVLPMLDAVDPLATVAGAVNTVVAQSMTLKGGEPSSETVIELFKAQVEKIKG